MKKLGKILLWTIAITIPLFGVWVASSCAAYRNLPRAVAIASGLLLFPLLPLMWEAWSRTRAKAPRFGLGMRLVIRTLIISVAFLALVIGFFARDVFAALATRGDWMLDRSQGRWADATRGMLHHTADGLSWAYEAARDNPFAKYAEKKKPPPPPRPEPSISTPHDAGVEARDAGVLDASSPPPPVVAEAETPKGRIPSWPMAPKLHPAVVALTADKETSIDAVAHALADAEPDPFLRVKALHDWVADRLSYDVAALRAKEMPSQEAAEVFKRRTAVCAGYSSLLAALGHAIGEQIVVVSGDARQPGQEIDGRGHAWNAVKIDERWYLIDATWDGGGGNGDTWTKSYSTDYFLTPPEIFIARHFPSSADWQLIDPPLSRGDFLRRPILSAEFYALGLELLSPKRSQIDANGSAVIELANPKNQSILAEYEPLGFDSMSGGSLGAERKLDSRKCEVKDSFSKTRVECAMPLAGRYRVALFASVERYGAHPYVGEIEVNNRN
jgi:transglutaminase-like putative cysteine protease